MKQYKKHDRKRKYWFLNRVGKKILQLSTIAKEVEVMSSAHATALYLTQVEKNYSYSELPKV